MIIVNQNKRNLINFDKVIKIDIVDNKLQQEILEKNNLDIFSSLIKEKTGLNYKELNGYGLYAYFGATDNVMLGEYETNERAKEVLQEIAKKYDMYLQLNGGEAILQGQMDVQPNIFNIPKVYEMPKE